MTRFYVAEADVKRCREAVVDGRPITVSGIGEDGKLRGFTGIVQLVHEDGMRGQKRRWRVTILDAQITEPGNL